jgi:hypothetical protein
LGPFIYLFYNNRISFWDFEEYVMRD